MTRRRGFTLIELLVVIAIIGILAAMLFPVFARARESARKTQCLANVKNIALAMNMYLVDWDRFFPGETTAVAEAFFINEPGETEPEPPHENCNHKFHANPYLRYAVILDDYVKNRDVWRCPSAKMETGAEWIVNPYGPGGNGNWLTYLQSTVGHWGRLDDPRCAGGPCCVAWPPGWGGDVTDSILQGIKAGADTLNAFRISVSYSNQLTNLNPNAINDPAWFVTVADGGIQAEWWMPTNVAFPDICQSDCGPDPTVAGCCAADWENCPDTRDCGLDKDLKQAIFTEQSTGKPFTRHLGGSNLGFADGHAKWFSAYAILAESPSRQDPDGGHLRGLGCVIGIGSPCSE